MIVCVCDVCVCMCWRVCETMHIGMLSAINLPWENSPWSLKKKKKKKKKTT